MNKELRDKWVKALRSGDYEQGTQALFNSGAYCCLGVLCEIQGYKKLVHQGRPCFFNETGSVLNGIGLVCPNDGYNSGLDRDTRQDLAVMNDGGSTFNEIADWIEEHVNVSE